MRVRDETAETPCETARGAARKGGILEQDVERPSGEPARMAGRGSGLSRGVPVGVEAFMNNAG